ncbi:MAG: hypothetical protein ACYDBV_10510 [Nitrospiria bacterium]
MDKLIDLTINILLRFKNWDKTKVIKESKEFFQHFLKQLYNQIPGVSAAAGLTAGGWIASTFTTSPLKATLASWGLMKGGRHVVSGSMYQFLSIFVPLLVAGITAYIVQKLLKMFRARQMERNMAIVEQMEPAVQNSLREKLTILEKAKEAGILSSGEYFTKKSNLYQTYSRILPKHLKELLINKLTG